MSEQDQRAMYHLRDAIDSLSRNLGGQWEQQQQLLGALEQISCELAKLNEHLDKKKEGQ